MRILSLVNLLSLQAPKLAQKYKNDEILAISPLFDTKLNAKFIKCEIGAISYVLALVVKFGYEKFGKKDEYFENLDEAELSAESNTGLEEIDEIVKFLQICDEILVDETLQTHPDKENISCFLQKISEIFALRVVSLEQNELKFSDIKPTNLKELSQFNGAVVFKFKCKNLSKNLTGGKYFAICAKITDGTKVEISTPSLKMERIFRLDESIKGTVAYLGVENLNSYCYETAQIRAL